MNKRKNVLVIILVILITSIVTFTATTFFSIEFGDKVIISKKDFVQYQKLSKLLAVKSIIQDNYIEVPEEEDLYTGAVKGLVRALDDPYSVYFDKQEFAELLEHTQGEYSGLGLLVTVDPEDNLITVVKTFKDSPAQQVGIKIGDKIVNVNNQDVTGDEFDMAITMMKGVEGTEVDVRIFRPQEKKFYDHKIKRAKVHIDTVASKIYDKEIGYVEISTFDNNTAKEFETHLDGLIKQGIKGIIIDVRNNPGGSLEQVVEVTDKLVPEGLIVYTKQRDGTGEKFTADKDWVEMPIAVLINGGSASASEILAGAVKDRKSGILIGEKTFGKGLVQQLWPFEDGTGLKFTISKYYTPLGKCIQDIGIEPDIKVELPEEYKTSSIIEEKDDSQLQTALDKVNQMINE